MKKIRTEPGICVLICSHPFLLQVERERSGELSTSVAGTLSQGEA